MHLIPVPTQDLASLPATLVHLPNPLDPLDSLPKPPSALFTNPSVQPPSGLPPSALPQRPHYTTTLQAPLPQPLPRLPEERSTPAVPSRHDSSFTQPSRYEAGSLPLGGIAGDHLQGQTEDISPSAAVNGAQQEYNCPSGEGPEAGFPGQGQKVSREELARDGRCRGGPEGSQAEMSKLDADGGREEELDLASTLKLRRKLAEVLRHRDFPPLPPVPRACHTPCGENLEPLPSLPLADHQGRGMTTLPIVNRAANAGYPLPIPERHLRGTRSALDGAAHADHSLSTPDGHVRGTTPPHRHSAARAPPSPGEQPQGRRSPQSAMDACSTFAPGRLQETGAAEAREGEEGVPQPSPLPPRLSPRVPHVTATESTPILHDLKGRSGSAKPYSASQHDPRALGAWPLPPSDPPRIFPARVESNPQSFSHPAPLIHGPSLELPSHMEMPPQLCIQPEAFIDGPGDGTATNVPARPELNRPACAHSALAFPGPHHDTSAHVLARMELDHMSCPNSAPKAGKVSHPPQEYGRKLDCQRGLRGGEEDEGEAAAGGGPLLGSWQEGTGQGEGDREGHLGCTEGQEGEEETAAWDGHVTAGEAEQEAGGGVPQGVQAQHNEVWGGAGHGPAIQSTFMHDVHAQGAAPGPQPKQDESIPRQNSRVNNIPLERSCGVQDTAVCENVLPGNIDAAHTGSAAGLYSGQAVRVYGVHRGMETGGHGQSSVLDDITGQQNMAQDSLTQEGAVQRVKYACGTREQEGGQMPGRHKLGRTVAEVDVASEWAAAQLCSSMQLIEKVC